MDLVEIAATANPPVCRLMDYGKFKYQEQKKAAEAKAKQTVIEIKEVKFRPGTDDGDYNIKLRNIRRFLAEGDKCKITLRFRGREITHQEIGMALLQRIRDDLGDTILVEQFLKLEGRQMIMMIAPGKKKPGAAKPASEPVRRRPRRRRTVSKPSRWVAAVAVKEDEGRLGKPCFPRREAFACQEPSKVARGHQGAGVSRDASRAQMKKEHSMPKMKTKSGAKKRFRASRRDRQARPGLQASHPDQEVHQEQAPPARTDCRP